MKFLTVFFLILWLIFSASLQASVSTPPIDTTKKRRIEYEFKRETRGNTTYYRGTAGIYYFEGDSLDTDLTIKNLLKDTRHIKKMRKEIRKLKRTYFWKRILYRVLSFSVFIVILPLLIIFCKPSVGGWIGIGLGLAILDVIPFVLGGISVTAMPRMRVEKLMKIIDKYNEIVDKDNH